MPLNISPELQAHIAGTTTTLATCTKLDLVDGQSYYLTSLDQEILYQGDLYIPNSGYSPTSSQTKINLSVDNLNIIGVIDNDDIKVEDLLAGRFDYADARIFQVNYEDLSMGDMVLIAGKTGQVIVRDNQYTIELRSLSQLFQQSIGEVYTVHCQADLGDDRCKVDLGPLTVGITVVSVDPAEPDRVFQTGLTAADGEYDQGKVTWQTGVNTFFEADVKTYLNASGRVELYEPMPFVISPGDTGIIVPGCAKTLDACKNRYSNLPNHRGFSHILGLSKSLRGS